MKIAVAVVVFAVLFSVFILLPGAQADEIDQSTTLTFSQPVDIPGHVLGPGTYTFVLVDGSDREIVRIFTEDRKLVATLLTIPVQRAKSSNSPTVVVAEQRPDAPSTLVAWFYSSSTQGHQFIYEKAKERELASAKHETIVAGD
jgi:hypothetical protein